MIDLSKYNLVFEDNFDTLSLFSGASGTWKPTYYYGDRTLGGNGERQFYVDPAYNNLGLNPYSVQDGVLTITAQPAPDALKPQINNLDYTSGLISSEQSFSMQYGYFEMRAQLPAGTGLWPAFWMLPVDGSWPPELDIMEVLGNDPTKLYSTAHSNASGTHTAAGSMTTVANMSTGYHTYGVDWGPTTITWYFDGQKVFETATPTDMQQPMYMIANLAVGGYWPGNPDASTTFPAEMKIDYIRAYTRPSDHVAVAIPASWAEIPLTTFSSLDGTGALQIWDYRHVMDATTVKLQLMGDWSRYAVGNSLDNYIAGSNAQYNELNGGKGNDVLKGNGGIDVFVMSNDAGSDVILDFSNTSGNSDKIRLDGFHFRHFDDVKPWLKQVGSDTVLRLDQDQALLLKNVTADTLQAQQFVFVNSVAAPADPVPVGTTTPPAPTTTITTITGTDSNDVLTGTAGSDLIYGKGGNDTIQAYGGNDTIIGSSGKDMMSGGAGDDTYVFKSILDSPKASRDVIIDWVNGNDTVDLREIDASTKTTGNQAFTWIGTKGFSGKVAQLHYYFDGQNTIVEGNTNTDRVADFQIQISGKVLLDARDFML